ncbi:MAG: hypothetical protein O8C66_07015 [Candidatus Methanoperedens sp.]|nr:hypothetical protein [Candidatus Methanoperedens sp.]
MLEKFRSFGLTKYESDVYLTLLRLGSADANLISSTSGVPLGRIYGILSSLQDKRIVRSQETRPRKFAAVEPGTSLKYLLDAQRETIDIIIEQINQVNEEMCLTVGYPEFSKYLPSMNPEKSDTKKALLRALERGVKFRMLIDRSVNYAEESRDETGQKIFKYLGKNLHCRTTTFTSTLFDVIDDDRINLKISSPVKKEELFAIVHVRDKKLAAEMKEHFEDMWEKAQELKL